MFSRFYQVSHRDDAVVTCQQRADAAKAGNWQMQRPVENAKIAHIFAQTMEAEESDFASTLGARVCRKPAADEGCGFDDARMKSERHGQRRG